MSGLLRAVVVLAGTAALTGCVDPYVYPSQVKTVGLWNIERQRDRVADTPIPSAFLMANASSSTENFTKRAILQLSCHKGEPIVRIGFEFKIGSNRTTMMGYRFDDKPGREIEARFLQDYHTAVIYKRDEVAQFATDLRDAKALYVRIRSLNAGRSTAEFLVEGGHEAADAVFAMCPIATSQARDAALFDGVRQQR